YERKAIPLTDLAWVRYRAQRFEDAAKLAGEALALESTYVPARQVQALAELGMGHAQSALAITREIAEDRTGRVGAIAATALALMGDVEAAQKELTRVSTLLR